MHYRALVTLLALFSTLTAHGADLKRGADLFRKNCIACHVEMSGGDGSGLFTRADRKVRDLGALQRQVRRCKDNLGLTWFDDEVDDVVAHVNLTYYRFK